MDLLRLDARSIEDQVTADFFTINYRITATVVVGQRHLVDVLCDQTTNFLELSEVYVSRIDEPTKMVSTHASGSLAKDRINLVLLPNMAEGVVKLEQYFTRTSKGQLKLAASPEDIFPVFVTLPSFNVNGKITWRRKLDTVMIMAYQERTFLPIFDVTIHNARFPDIYFTGPISLVHKAKVEVLCADDSVKAK